MYDNICKLIAEEHPEDFATWLLGKAIALTELKPTELSSEPIRADSLVLLQSEDLVLHLEFQTKVDPQIPFRMLNYWVRLHHRYPQKKVVQVVIYLRSTRSPLAYQDNFALENTTHQF